MVSIIRTLPVLNDPANDSTIYLHTKTPAVCESEPTDSSGTGVQTGAESHPSTASHSSLNPH